MALAKRIIAQAQVGERDPEHLCESALQGVSRRQVMNDRKP